MPSIFSADWRNEVDKELQGKADKATSLAGYGITDAYTQAQTDAAIADVLVDFSDELDQKVDRSEAASFLRADGTVVADKLTIGSKGLNFGSQTVAEPTDVSRHIALYSTTYGFSVSDGTLNYMAGNTRHAFYLGGTMRAAFLAANIYYIDNDGVSRGVWHSGNFNPETKLNLSGGTMTGKLIGLPYNGNPSQTDGNAGFEIRNVGGSGDAGLAVLAFHCQGTFGMKVHLRNDGTFGWGGWSSAAWRFYQQASGNVVASGNITAYSDPRLKDDVERIQNALSIVSQLDGVRFTWNGKTTLIGRPGARDIGVLADQVEAVLPEIVDRSIEDEANGGERWRVVAYDKLVPVLIEAVKELAARVEALEAGR
ncbi:MAG TPA: tail fiber domain-containing protein [Rhizobiaceae bacterium]|nr:tail fiber domain-containing protein [Rhizobiaceae bacterium]